MDIENHNVANTVQDLCARWIKAREAAFKSSFSISKTEDEFLLELNSLEDERFEEFLKLIFLNSRNLGIGYQKAKGMVWEKSDFAAFVQELGSPCLLGLWEKKASAYILKRSGCHGGNAVGQRFCQYWREAIDGLVTGISDEVGFVRNSSIAVQDSECVDVFYDEEANPTDAIWSNANKWGAVPANIRDELDCIETKFSEMKIDLKFLGIREKNLLYKLEPKENLTCGSAGTIYRNHLEKLVKEKFPNFHLKDASPVAVYGERT